MARRNWKDIFQGQQGFSPRAISQLEGMEDDLQTALAGVTLSPVPIVVGGNSAGVAATISSGTATLAGGANITLSQVGNAISFVGGAGGAGGINMAASNTTYTSGTVTISGVGGGITVQSNTGQRVDLSVAAPVAQTVQTQNLHNVTLAGNTVGVQTIISSGTMTLAGGANVVLSQAGNAVTISALGQTTQTQNLHNVTISGNTSGALAAISSGTLTLAGGNNITLSQAGNAVTISAASTSQSTQTQNLFALTISGNTSGALAGVSSGTLTLHGGNNITLSQNANAITISGPNAGGAQTAISGVVASNTTYTSGTIAFTGSNMITVKSSGAGQTIILDATQSAQTQSVIQAFVPVGNTSGTTGSISSGTIALSGGANITISQSSGTNSTRLVIVGGGGGAGVALSASDSVFSSGTIVLSGQGALTVGTGASTINFSVPQTSSLSADAGVTISTVGSTIHFSAGFAPMAQFENFPINQIVTLSSASALSKKPLFWAEDIPGGLTMNRVLGQLNHVTTNSAQSYSVHFGVYSIVNSSSLSLLGSASDSYAFSTASSASYSGQRGFVMTSPSTVPGISNLGAGAYIFASMVSAAANGSMNFQIMGASGVALMSGLVGPGVNVYTTASTGGFLQGYYTATSGNLPANVALSEIQDLGTAVIKPYMLIRS